MSGSRPTGRALDAGARRPSPQQRARQRWERLRGKLGEAGVGYQEESGTSIYFRDPDGARLELIADPLGEMYGAKVM